MILKEEPCSRVKVDKAHCMNWCSPPFFLVVVPHLASSLYSSVHGFLCIKLFKSPARRSQVVRLHSIYSLPEPDTRTITWVHQSLPPK